MQAISKWLWEIFATKGVTIATSHGSPPIINYDKQNHELRCCLPKLEYKFCFSSGSIEWFYTVCQKVSLRKGHWGSLKTKSVTCTGIWKRSSKKMMSPVLWSLTNHCFMHVSNITSLCAIINTAESNHSNIIIAYLLFLANCPVQVQLHGKWNHCPSQHLATYKQWVTLYLTVIPWVHVGYEMVDSQRGA